MNGEAAKSCPIHDRDFIYECEECCDDEIEKEEKGG